MTSIKADDIVWVNVDKAMMDDILGPRVEIADNLVKMGAKIWDPQKVVIVSDHYTPPANIKQANIVKFTRDWASENKVSNYYEFAGPCHQVMVDKGHVVPGTVVVGTDSHTTTYGALTCFSSGIGSTEMSGVLATGQIWMKVPQTIHINWDGELHPGVMAKDVSLHTIKHLGHAGATYKSMEYDGSSIRHMIMDERMCLSNMAVEAGAKAGIIGYDQITAEYMKRRFGITDDFSQFNSDADANYIQTLNFDASQLVPQVACPHEVDNVFNVVDVNDVKVNQVYIGSCTGGRYHDLKMAAELLKGKTVEPTIRVLVSPASKDIYNECLKDGILSILADAGCIILGSTCGACLGVHSGNIGDHEVCVSTTNRNFLGRMGSKSSGVYLVSPLTAAATALTGKLTDPRKFL
ncbi:aconitase/3-isopropylmalate dehydratase large subunit family protein [Peptoniphilus equinus]|uniref:Aconitase/3-isopropylmalate dehydratase large subunit family protein n=1 Tax=Peptoniphilus equinus TaxID=3016343 RepID=A0ABY7QRJ0_9FIRM|nr:aconitase/3-isopropylmalate dehydratase large subunit family protein [Peptoniphilus equinus]WBW49392.1 aconitase/3-isopropylmalate dehydratase large subunit family protein [Peptoniphilus equinus]